MRTLCLYVFHQHNARVDNFIKRAIFYKEDVDFIIISNDKEITRDDLNIPDYCKFLSRNNIGYDFGGWSDALLTNNLYKNYDSFIFVNSSAIGPFLPSYFKGYWTDIYLDGLKDNIKIFGSTINTLRNPIHLSHVQSYIYAMNRDTLELLISEGIFSNLVYEENFQGAINREIYMSRIIIKNKGNIGSLFKYYEGVDFTFKDKQPEEYNRYFLDDIMYQQYYNKLWNKYDLVFIKGNRGINVLI